MNTLEHSNSGLQTPSGLRKGFSIRGILVSAVLALSGMVVLALLWLGSGSLRDYRDAVDTRIGTKAGNEFVVGIYDLLMERLHTNNALQAEGVISAKARAEINKHRQNFSIFLTACTYCSWSAGLVTQQLACSS